MKHYLLTILSQQVGRAKTFPAKTLAAVFRCSQVRLHELVNEMRMDGIAVCGDLDAGFFIAGTVEELQEICSNIRRQAGAAIALEAKLRQVPCVDVLDFIAQDLEKREGYRIAIVRSAAMAAARRDREAALRAVA
jgi:hypothetical protein